MRQSRKQVLRKNPLLLKRLTLTNHLLNDIKAVDNLIEDVIVNCKELTHLKLGYFWRGRETYKGGAIWNGSDTISDPDIRYWDEDGPLFEQPKILNEMLELDPKLIATNLHKLVSLKIGPYLTLTSPQNEPPILNELLNLEELAVFWPNHHTVNFKDRSIRTLAQNSEKLRILDLRSYILGIFTLDHLKTEVLEALHVRWRAPAASVLSRWAHTLRYLSLLSINSQIQKHFCRPPDEPDIPYDARYEWVDNCLRSLIEVDGESKLEQLDIQRSVCSLDILKLLVKKCKRLTYLDTRGSSLPDGWQGQFTSSAEILQHFS